MTFASRPSEYLKKILRILKRKDPALFITIKKKMWQIANSNKTDIEHFKNQRSWYQKSLIF